MRLSKDIRKGVLASGEKLPSKRRLANNLNISVNTVDTAYQMLVAEGYVASKPKSGYTVLKIDRLQQNIGDNFTSFEEQQKARQNLNAATNLHSLQNTDESNNNCISYNFSTSSTDTSLFGFKTWQRVQREVYSESEDILNHGHPLGDVQLRYVLARHLAEFRGAKCAPHQIIIGAGIEYLLSLLALLFKKRTFAVENPGYYRAVRILKNNGINVKNISVDKQGMSADELCASGAHIAYITPSHQFPTGVTMPIGRRTQLLYWAQQSQNRYIIEDDYNSEFRFDGKPIMCLQGLDDGENVIYVSTFSKSLSPALRIAYMVLPQKLLLEFNNKFGFYSCTVSRFDQQTLYKYMLNGHFSRHLARVRNCYKAKRDALCTCLKQAFGSEITLTGKHTGLHIVLQTKHLLQGDINYEKQLFTAAKNNGIKIYTLSEFCNSSNIDKENTRCGIVLGYGGLSLQEIENGVLALKKAWADICY